MNNYSGIYIKTNALDYDIIGEGVKRKVLCYNENLMMVEVLFEKGSEGAMHDHPHHQVSYVKSGAFEVTIGKKTMILNEGDSFIVPPGEKHGVKALDAGCLVDVFNPLREDFLG